MPNLLDIVNDNPGEDLNYGVSQLQEIAKQHGAEDFLSNAYTSGDGSHIILPTNQEDVDYYNETIKNSPPELRDKLVMALETARELSQSLDNNALVENKKKLDTLDMQIMKILDRV